MMENMPTSDSDKGQNRLKQALLKYRQEQKFKRLSPMKLRPQVHPPRRDSLSAKFLAGWMRLRSSDSDYAILRAGGSNEYKTKVLASMLPDEIILHTKDFQSRHYETAMMFTDVSGFTDLSEKYNKMGKSGASILSQTLNRYMGTMIQEILSNGGDVLKFAGDAFLVIFKVTQYVSMQDAVHKAIDTALTIQKNYGTNQTEVGVVLRVKIVISAGSGYFKQIGDENQRHYVFVGRPVWDAKESEQFVNSGEVIVHPRAWRFIKPVEYISSPVKLGRGEILVKGFSDSWRYVQRHFDERLASLPDVDELWDIRESGDGDLEEVLVAKRTEYLIRPSINVLARNGSTSLLRSHMIAPLMRAIDELDPLENFNEMRRVEIVFVNVVVEPCGPLELIERADSTYKIVCRIAKFFEGIVNKVSLFDKDMMFLVVFGLRGFKKEVQAKSALRCAEEMQKSISEQDGIVQASVGVTSGNTYCGVVGHELRREYTVISMAVNKAARLMMAYPSMVTCDKQAFMSSRMKSCHFTLMEPRELKGLSNVGPIYRFEGILVERVKSIPRAMNSPLLGREESLKAFRVYLDRALSPAEQSRQIAVLFTGPSTSGKTFLVDHLFFLLYNEQYNCVKLTVHVNQKKEPFSVTWLYLCHPMKLEPDSSVDRRQMRLVELMAEFEMNHLLCVLNPILGVAFETNAQIENMSDDERIKVRSNLFRMLCQKVFTEFWIIFIDNVLHADQESLELIKQVLEIYKVFFVFTSTEKRATSNLKQDLFAQPNLKEIFLGPINQVYQKSIACRFLKVDAIPLDLERTLHMKSSGNPGWIISFLDTLLKDKVLTKKQMSLSDAKMRGVVFGGVAIKDGKMVEVQTKKFADLDPWNTNALDFKDWFKTWTDIKPEDDKSLVWVALLTKELSFETFDMEFIEDAHILTQYDSLSSFEQQVVKCASVIGMRFLRSMLLYLMPSNERKITMAIQKLFEVGVFECAGGNFLHGTVIYQASKRISETRELKCVCDYLKISEDCKHLPRYASCGYMQFKSEHFKRTIYDLLTDNQRKEFHTKSFRYLENETKQCESCGGIYFHGLSLGDNEQGTIYDTRLSTDVVLESVLDSYDKFGYVSNVTLSSLSDAPRTSRFTDSLIFASDRLKQKTLIHTHENYDFQNCECDMILYTTYSHMLKHSRAAESMTKTIEILIEQANVSTTLSNYPRALNILEEAVQLIKKHPIDNFGINVYFNARVHTLRGVCHFHLDQPNRSMDSLYEAAKCMGLKFPKVGSSVTFRLNWTLFKIKCFIRGHTETSKNVKRIYELIVWQLSECYSAMFMLLKNLKYTKLAALAAVEGLLMTLKHPKSFISLLNSFADVLLILSHIGKADKYAWMQEKAFELSIIALKDHVDAKLLSTVSSLYYSISLCISIQPTKDMAINLCFLTLQFNKSIGLLGNQLKIAPLLVDLLLSQKRVYEAIIFLRRFGAVVSEYSDINGLVWYYALAMDIMLDTGVTVEFYKDAKHFFLREEDSLRRLKDTTAQQRFFLNMRLWALRNKALESASIWSDLLDDFALDKYDAPSSVFNAIRWLESLILTLISIIKTRNLNAIEIIEKKISKLCTTIEKAVRNTCRYRARFHFLRCYFQQVRKFKATNIDRLDEIRRLALNSGDFLSFDLILHNQMFWIKALPYALEDLWIERCGFGNPYTEENLLANGQKLYVFSLPLPDSGYF